MSEFIPPKHIGFIMDGNGRWAKLRGRPRNYGHKKGADVIEAVVKHCHDRGVKAVSLYAFSTENWSRPKEEVDFIFDILRRFLKKYKKKLIANEIRFLISGNLAELPEELRAQCEDCISATEVFTEKFLNIAINYGSRSELTRAVNALIASGKKEVTEADVSAALYTSLLPDIDLVIRTSGEQRLSNFFMWQCAYAELYFTDVLWPDFDDKELDKALDWFASRGRRYGGI